MVTFYLGGRVWKNDSRPTTAPESEGGVMGAEGERCNHRGVWKSELATIAEDLRLWRGSGNSG